MRVGLAVVIACEALQAPLRSRVLRGLSRPLRASVDDDEDLPALDAAASAAGLRADAEDYVDDAVADAAAAEPLFDRFRKAASGRSGFGGRPLSKERAWCRRAGAPPRAAAARA